MSKRYQLLRAGDNALVDYALYSKIRDEAAALMHLAGSEIKDSTYTLDVQWWGHKPVEYGVGSALHNFLWLRQYDNADRNHEAMLLVLEQDLVIGSMRHNLFSRRVGVTVFNGAVKYAQLKTVQPRIYHAIPEAQPETDLRGAVREDFETWEFELRQNGELTQACAEDVLSELIELKTV